MQEHTLHNTWESEQSNSDLYSKALPGIWLEFKGGSEASQLLCHGTAALAKKHFVFLANI